MLAEERWRKLEGERLLQPAALNNAVNSASEDRILELMEEYGDWITNLQGSLNGAKAPISAEDFLARIARTDGMPTHSPEEGLRLLQGMGFIVQRRDGRYAVPRIYLRGFQMTSRGGPAQ
jgi:hypothetical protein